MPDIEKMVQRSSARSLTDFLHFHILFMLVLIICSPKYILFYNLQSR